MKKKVMIGFLLVALFIVGGFALLLSNLDAVVKIAIEKHGTAVTGTEVKVSGVTLSTSSGEGVISGLEVGNPPGFSAQDAFKINHISIRFDKNTVFSNPIVINEITGLSPHITVEYDDKNRLNLQVIEENALGYSVPAAGADAGQSGARKLIVEDFFLSGAQVQISHKSLNGKTITVPLSDIHLVDLGKSEGGVAPAEITKLIVIGIMQVVIKDVNAQLSEELQQELRSSLNNLYKEGSDKLKGLMGK